MKIDILTGIAKIVFIAVVLVLFLIQISMLNQYSEQYRVDNKITTEIDKKLLDLGFNSNNRSNIYLKNFSYNNVGRVRYGDYIYGLYHYYWSAEAFLDLNSGNFAKVAIEVPMENYFTSRNIGKDEFLKLRPLTIMSYTGDEECEKEECLKVEAVIR